LWVGDRVKCEELYDWGGRWEKWACREGWVVGMGGGGASGAVGVLGGGVGGGGWGW